jgi:long-chain fatty acid transport protein
MSARPCRPCNAGARATALVAALIALAVAAAAPPVRAAGFASARFGGEHGHVTTTNPTALYYNPAGIALSPGPSLFVDGVLAWRRGSWEHVAVAAERPDPPDAQGANSGRAELSNLFGAPMIGASFPLGRLSLGAAVHVPFGGRSHWSPNSAFAGHARYPLAADGVQRWHSIEGALTFVYGTLGAALRLGDLAIGVTGNLVRSSVSSTQAKNVVGNGEPDTSREGRVVLDVTGLQASFGLGALWQVLPDRLWLGASYQAQPGLGEMKLDGTLKSSYAGDRTEFAVTLHQALPDIVRVGARFRPLAALELRLSLDRTRWSALVSQCASLRGTACQVFPSGADATAELNTIQNIRRRWRDTYGVRLGASHFASERVELFVGAGYETGAAPDETLEPSLMDGNNLTGALGGRFQVLPGWSLLLTGSYVYYLPRNNIGMSRLLDAELPTRRADGGGRYNLSLSLLQLAVEKRWD